MRVHIAVTCERLGRAQRVLVKLSSETSWSSSAFTTAAGCSALSAETPHPAAAEPMPPAAEAAQREAEAPRRQAAVPMPPAAEATQREAAETRRQAAVPMPPAADSTQR